MEKILNFEDFQARLRSETENQATSESIEKLELDENVEL